MVWREAARPALDRALVICRGILPMGSRPDRNLRSGLRAPGGHCATQAIGQELPFGHAEGKLLA